jgi:hypothetical protein
VRQWDYCDDRGARLRPGEKSGQISNFEVIFVDLSDPPHNDLRGIKEIF